MFEMWPVKKSTIISIKKMNMKEIRAIPWKKATTGSVQAGFLKQGPPGARSDVKTGEISSILSSMDEYQTSSSLIFKYQAFLR